MENNIIIPFCIYNRNSKSLIVNRLSSTIPCFQPCDGSYFYDKFYAINPLYIPIPFGTQLLCAKKGISSVGTLETVSIDIVYDPFDTDEKNCVFFITWMTPVPYTTPLFVYSSNNGVLLSFEEQPITLLKTLYVLTNHPRKTTIKSYTKDSNEWFKINKKTNTPLFRFKNYMGRCIPEPSGIELEKCTLLNDIYHNKEKTILEMVNTEEDSNLIYIYLSIAIVIIIFYNLYNPSKFP